MTQISASREDQPRNIIVMTARLGIDVGKTVLPRPGLLYATALRRCAGCLAKQACREWLDQTLRANSAPAFCPNVDIFCELLAIKQAL